MVFGWAREVGACESECQPAAVGIEMTARTLMWLLALGAPVASWNLPPMAGLRVGGLWWAMMAAATVLYPLRNLQDYRHTLDYGLFLLYAATSLFWLDVDLHKGAVQEIVQLGVPLIMWAIGRHVNTDRSKQTGPAFFELGPLAACATLLLLPAVAQMVTGIKLLHSNGRPGAITLIFVGACALGRVSAGDRRGWLVAAMCFGYCFQTGARMATFALLALAVLMPTRTGSLVKKTALLAAMAGVIALTFTSAQFQRRFFGGRGAEGGSVDDLLEGRIDSSGRFELWGLLWEKAMARPVHGYGAGSSSYESARAGEIAHPHNDYLRILYDYGLAGFAIFWLFYVRIWLRALFGMRRGRESEAYGVRAQVYLALSGLLLISATDNPVIYTSHFMYLVFFLIGLLGQIEAVGRSGSLRPG